MEIDVYFWRYALIVVHGRNERTNERDTVAREEDEVGNEIRRLTGVNQSSSSSAVFLVFVSGG